jgi:hypothetical protein
VLLSTSLLAGASSTGGCRARPASVLLRGVDGRPSRKSARRAPRRGHPGIIGVVGELGVFVQESRPLVDGVEGATCTPSEAEVLVESADVYAVNYPRESGALADSAVDSDAVRGVTLRRRVKCDKLTVTKPHGEVRDRSLLVFEPGCEIARSRDERVGLVN